MEHQQVLEELEAARLRVEGKHQEALRGFQERLDEKSRLISSYSSEIQQLRQQLGEQDTATQAAATRAASQEKELQEQLQTREREFQEQFKAATDANAALKGELDVARNDLRQLDEENSEKASRISRLKDELRRQKEDTELVCRNHAKLGSQHQESTALLRKLAEVGNKSLAKLGVPPAVIDSRDISTLIPFFAEFVGRLTAVEERIRRFGNRQVSVAASQVASAILPRVHQAYPEFPFETIFNDWSPDENKEEHANAISRFVDEMVARMTGQAGAGDDEGAAATEEAPAAETTTPEAPPA